MRGPAMPANRSPGSRARTASISSAPRASPDASPATMPTTMPSLPWRIARESNARVDQPTLRRRSTDDPPTRGLEKGAQKTDRRHGAGFGRDRLARGLQRQLGAIERLVRPSDRGEVSAREAPAAQPLGVDAAR